MGGRSRKKSNKLDGGFLFSSPPSRGIDQDSISGSGSGRRSKPQRIRGIAVGYMYPQENVFVDGDGNLVDNTPASNPILLADSHKSSIAVSSNEGRVEDEVAVDYFEGNKLGGIDLQEASMEYGMKNPELFRKYSRNDKKSTPVTNAYPSLLDDIMRIKDPRTFFGKKNKVARHPRSWMTKRRKCKRVRKILGWKMRHRKEMIAANCRNRMVGRGVDLQKINLKLKKMVLDGTDTHSFSPKPKKVGACSYKSSKEAKDSKTGKVQFVSSGILNTKIVEMGSNEEGGNNVGVKAAAECGAFEIHTTGFGSKMLSKMGYVEGGGLGKDGQGMAQPIQVSQRPKLLGLGAHNVKSAGIG